MSFIRAVSLTNYYSLPQFHKRNALLHPLFPKAVYNVSELIRHAVRDELFFPSPLTNFSIILYYNQSNNLEVDDP